MEKIFDINDINREKFCLPFKKVFARRNGVSTRQSKQIQIFFGLLRCHLPVTPRNDVKAERNDYVNRKNFSTQTAFTLAEVLITLGIIGVVAALTIPSLLQNLQMKDLETRFQKSYAILSSQYRKIYSDEGNIDLDFSNTEGQDTLFSYFSIIKGPVVGRTLYNNKVLPMNMDKTLTTTPNYNINTSSFWVVLKDGSIMGLYGNAGQGYAPNRVMIDTNGAAPPNRLGYDFFGFGFSKGKVYPAGYVGGDYENWTQCAPINKGGSSSRYDNGTNCARYAIRNVCPWDSSKTYWECLP